MLKTTQITPRLFVRGRLSTKWDVLRVDNELRNAGVSTLLSLTPVGEPAAASVPWLEYVHRPMSDSGGFDRVEAEALGRAVAHRVLQGRTVLVSCRAGRNRSCLVAALALRDLEGISGAEALRIVRERRPRAIANESFARWLEGLPCS